MRTTEYHHDPLFEDRLAEAQWRLAVIQPALRYRGHTRERAVAVAEVAEGRFVHPTRGAIRVAERTIQLWVKKYEAGGINGLMDKQRSDTGQARVYVSRKWDRLVPFPEPTKAQIAGELQRYVRSLWAAGAPSWPKVVRLGSSRLMELCRAAGWDCSEGLLREGCELPRRYVEDEREYQKIAVHDLDAKKFNDDYVPRIRRAREAVKPLNIIVGDVHPIDVYIRRPDGTLATPKAISWFDMGTHRLYVTLILLEAGEGVRREHVAASFSSMVEAWGLPELLYLDNGSEYNWTELLDAFARLAALVEGLKVRLLSEDEQATAEINRRRRYVIRARPYSANSKPIEGAFGLLERSYLSMFPGWIGGDRMRAKTANVGKEPHVYPDGMERFHADFEAILRFYHTQPQEGALGGRSPDQVLRDWIGHGWGKTAVDPLHLLMAFAGQESREVKRGHVRWRQSWYFADALVTLPPGTHVDVRVPFHDPRLALVLRDGQPLCMATLDHGFDPRDGTGAQEQTRRKAILRRHISERRMDCDRLDLLDEVRRDLIHQPGAPVAPVAQQVEITPELRALIKKLNAAALVEREARTTLPLPPPAPGDQWDEFEDPQASLGWGDE